jgi:uncharacterized membrane protein
MIRRIFITGLITLIPLAITIYVVVGVFQFADGILGEVINKYLMIYFGYKIPGLGIILSLLIVFIAGFLVVLSKTRIVEFLEKIFFRIPLVKNIYFPTKKIVDFLFLEQPTKFRAVVLVQYPRKGSYSIGFVTGESPQEFNKKCKTGKLYNVFISSSPSPLTGFTICVPQEDIIFLDMTIEQAIKFIVSAGMVGAEDESPEARKFLNQRLHKNGK